MLADALYHCVRKISKDTFLGKLLRLPLRLIPRSLVIPILSGAGRGKKWILGSSHVAVWMGIYELEVQRVLQKFIKKGRIVYDVGSNVGFFTIVASELVGPEGRVVAFEPLVRSLHFLREHIRLNSCTNVMVMDVAVSSESGVGMMNLGPGDETTGYLLARLSQQGQFEVNTVALDDVVFESGIPPPDFIKIDIEGAEILALQGARRTIGEFKPVICLSTHGDELKAQCVTLLESIGYICSGMRTRRVVREDELLCSYKGDGIHVGGKR